MKSSLLFMYTESSLHAGTGSALSAVDLPIQRERTTDYPHIQGSGVKGALRSQCEGEEDALNAVFGPDPTSNQAHEYAGAVSVGEARIVLFPVRSLLGVYAYVTCPHVLARLERDAVQAGVLEGGSLAVTLESQDAVLITEHSTVSQNDVVILEEYSFVAQSSQFVSQLANWLADNVLPSEPEYEYWRTKLRTSLVILPDNAFRDFVRTSTEVVTQVRLQRNTKTVADGALWTQESLPTDTLLASIVTSRRLRSTRNQKAYVPESLSDGEAASVRTWLQNTLPKRVQIGGDETTGMGVVSLRWQGGQ